MVLEQGWKTYKKVCSGALIIIANVSKQVQLRQGPSILLHLQQQLLSDLELALKVKPIHHTYLRTSLCLLTACIL